jgi:hypothetical protein
MTALFSEDACTYFKKKKSYKEKQYPDLYLEDDKKD